MTVKLVVLYATPTDADAFDRHYLDVHVPLVHQIPGLERAESAKLTAAADRGDMPYYRITELYFADQDAFNTAMRSVENRATAADYRQIAPPGSRMFVSVVDD